MVHITSKFNCTPAMTQKWAEDHAKCVLPRKSKGQNGICYCLDCVLVLEDSGYLTKLSAMRKGYKNHRSSRSTQKVEANLCKGTI